MHTEHTHVQWMVRRQSRKTEQRATSWHLSLLKEFFQLLTCITKFHTLTNQNKRFYRFIDHLGSFLDNVFVHRRNRLIRTNEIHLGRLIIHHGSLCILGKVKNHRSRTSTLCNIESTRYSPSHIFCTTNLITPFRNRGSDTYHIDLLECICTQKGSSHLSTNHYHWRGVNHCVCNTSNSIGSTRSTGNNSATHFSTYSCKTLCSMYCTLLMANQNVVESITIVVECIVNRHDSSTWIAE